MSDKTQVTTSDLVGKPFDDAQAKSFIRQIPDANLPTEYVEGILDIAHEGSGLLRPKNFSPSIDDVYISSSQIRRFNLRVGDKVGGQARRPKENERYWGLLKLEKINDTDSEEFLKKTRINFDDMMVIYPDEQLKLSTNEDVLTTRMVDLVAPVGFGQRALVVSLQKQEKHGLLKT